MKRRRPAGYRVIGKRFIFVHEVVTRGGTVFPVGTVLTCYGKWRGGFHLEDPNDRSRGVRHLSKWNIQQLSDGATDELIEALVRELKAQA